MTVPTPDAGVPHTETPSPFSPPMTSGESGGTSTPPVGAAGAGAQVEARIEASVENWQRKLLDLSKRNRALNFRMSKVSTIAIVDEQPAEAFRQLYLREQGMRFKAAPEEPPQEEVAPAAVTETPSATAVEEEAEDNSLELDFAPYDPRSLDERHTDEWLQTTSTPEALDKSLRRLDEQARLSVEEQGVNTLFMALGMLHYKESPDLDQLFNAPIVLLPVELTRKSARSGYVVRATDDDPIVNPALAEYLRQQFGITLPELPDSNAIPNDYDLQTLLTAVSDAVKGRQGWAVKTDIYLGLFSFQKFVMYKDLEANGPALETHRLIRQLVTRSGGQIVGLPSEIRQMDLDREYPPEQTHQVVDADSSQLRAIAATARDYDLVIEGPPGTGKSQTITNLIAQALAGGRSVLFVAEKMAALKVVYDRLVRAGLGEFCLELHSTKANKRAVMKELAAALDASLQKVAAPTVSTQRLPQVRAMLTEYVRAVHTPFGTLGVSPYRGYGELGRVIEAPRVRYTGPVDGVVTLDQLEQTVRDLTDLAATSTEIGVPAQHPWRDAGKTFYSENDLAAVREHAVDLLARLDDITRRAAGVREAFGLPEARTLGDVDTVAAIGQVLARSPGAPLSVLESETWNVPPADATALVARGRELNRLTERVGARFAPEVLEQEHAADIAYVEQKSQGILSFLAFLDGRYRSVKKRWLSYRLPSFQGSLVDQANEMKQVDRLRQERNAMAELDAKGSELFGALWQGERSSWDALESYIHWVVEFRGLYVKHGLAGRALEVASRATPDVSQVEALRAAATDALERFAELRGAVGWPSDYLAQAPISEIMDRVRSLADNVMLGPKWAAFEAARRTVDASIARELLPPVMTGELAFKDLAPAFLRAFYLKWLSAVVQARPPLEKFHTMAHEERLAEFRRLDERVLLENRAALVSRLRDRVQERLQQPSESAAMPYLRREMARQRGLSPLRKTLQYAEPAIRAIKPCFMMSPLTVAQLLDGSASSFDLVIFDEASQLPPEDAVGAIIRGKQLVVVGDPKQLPPTNFFSVSSEMATAPLADDGTPMYEDSESILEEYMGAGVPMSRLKWHYRSAHESLITFSNVSFYDADLYTFPSADRGTETLGLQFDYVADGVYEGKGLNAAEAGRVADAVVRFAKEQIERQSRGERMQSLGVGTFNVRQQLAIQDELELRRRNDPTIEPFFDRGIEEPFFVKNLENIQGDERDVIFISVTYAKGADGRIRYNFGPLNGENGWRRLNVLATRARRRMRVFSSMRGDEIDATSTESRGAKLLRDFLLYAERGQLDGVAASASAEAEWPFEQDVVVELTKRGVTVVPQVGVAGYRIDLGVVDDAMPGRFLCGIECDGLAYHQSETARDRDRLRQQVLEARGWTIHRVWSTDWFKDRQGQIDRLLKLIEEARARARAAAEAERQAREQASADAARRGAAEAQASASEAATSGAADADDTPYQRPVAAPYKVTPGEGRYAGAEILDAPLSQLVRAVVTVVETESPVHETDLFTRVAGMWGSRVGSRIQARLREVCRSAERDNHLRCRGQFYWSSADGCTVRSRAGTRIPADHIAPEEYREAVLAVLASGHGFSRPQLTNEVRAMLGFSRTGAALDEAIGSAIDGLMAEGRLGEASTGIRLRR